MTFTELANALNKLNSGLEADIIARGGTPTSEGTAGLAAIALGALLLWWVMRNPSGVLSFVFGSLLWGLIIVEGFILVFGIPGKLEDQLTVQFFLLCWGVGFVFQRIEWRIIERVSK